MKVLRVQGLGFFSVLKLCGITVFLPLMLGVVILLLWALFNDNAVFHVNGAAVSNLYGFPVMLFLFAMVVSVATSLAAAVAWAAFSMWPIVLKVTRAEALRPNRAPAVPPDVTGSSRRRQ